MRMRVALFTLVALPLLAVDWPDFRGPNRDGRSPEKDLVGKWSPTGENLLWKAPYGGRSTPVILNNKVYLLNPAGTGETLQERVMCLDADTGKLVWEYKYNVYHSDVPPHRVAWSSPAADPETGNIYVLGVGGTVLALDGKTGKKIWERTMVEDFGIVTTHGGRTASPIVEGDLVVVSAITTGWGELARAAHRFIAFDKRTGETIYVSTPGGRPFDTTYSPPIVVTNNGVRTLIAGGGDGTIHAIKFFTGEPIWKYFMSKRGVNTGVVVGNGMAYVSHSEENLDSVEMGLLAAVDVNSKGDVTRQQLKWSDLGFQGGFSSPVIDGDVLYQVDNGSNLFAFDAISGKQLWKKNLGTIQKASPVLADGKIYVGNENGRFFVLKVGKQGADVLSQVQLGTSDQIEEITASPAISDGRVFVVSQRGMYVFGRKNVSKAPIAKPAKPTPGDPAYVLVTPTELVLKPGQSIALNARVFDANGNFIKIDKTAQWALKGLKGDIGADGKLTVPANSGPQAGLIVATVGSLTGRGRARVLPGFPLSQDFESLPPGPPPAYWINTTGKYQVRDLEGKRVLAKLADNPFTKRARSFFGQNSEHDYTIEADVMALEKRRQMGDGGVVGQRYQLVLYGNHQRLELQPWQPETKRTAAVPFPWKKDTWYRVKLRVENMPDGKVKAMGKAWAVSDPEPDKWLIERVDPIGNHHGAPGIYADAPFEVYFDNIKVSAN
ncbi:MAG: PQQ-binding-like beta-propeller repeat protein [Bryobacterales bacterium]|nr:PQQ-binding-like beta-propeller repeat protein [Bryobacterales bacterium]